MYRKYRADKVRSVFNCDQCNHILVDPVTLPCGNSVCKRHLIELLGRKSSKESTFKCELCQEEHAVPQKSFVVNKRMQIGLDIQLNCLRLHPVFEECKVEIESARENVAKIETLEKNAENYIYEYFEAIKRKVVLRRKDLKTKLDNCSNEVIRSISSSQMDCIKLSKQVNQRSIKIDQSKKELDELIVNFDTFDINEKKFGDIKQDVSALNASFNKVLAEYKDSLIGNNQYSFDFEEVSIKDLFGSFGQIAKFDSTIMNLNLQRQLVSLCEFTVNHKWELKYRASRDGFKTLDFHTKCDGLSNTLTIIESTLGCVFGGFAEKAWSSNGERITDGNSFIYSLVNKENRPFKVMCSNGGYKAIRCFAHRGPSFGGDDHYGGDIVINTNSNTNTDSYTSFGYSYAHPDYRVGTEKAQTILAGSFNFQTTEIEVYTFKTEVSPINKLN